MEIFRNRPLAFASCLFALVAFFLRNADSRIKLILVVVASVTLITLAFVKGFGRRLGRRRGLIFLCTASVLIASLSSFLFFDVYCARIWNGIGETCEIEGYVIARAESGGSGSVLAVRVEKMDGKASGFRALIEFEGESTLQSGECFRITATQRAF